MAFLPPPLFAAFEAFGQVGKGASQFALFDVLDPVRHALDKLAVGYRRPVRCGFWLISQGTLQQFQSFDDAVAEKAIDPFQHLRFEMLQCHGKTRRHAQDQGPVTPFAVVGKGQAQRFADAGKVGAHDFRPVLNERAIGKAAPAKGFARYARQGARQRFQAAAAPFAFLAIRLAHYPFALRASWI